MTQQFHVKIHTQKDLKQIFRPKLTHKIHSSMIHNSQKVETAQIYQLMNGKTNPYNGILLTNKKEWHTDTCYNMDEPWKYYTKWKKADIKGHILYDSIYMNCPK